MGLSKHRIKELDGLRGIAAIGVVLYHYVNRFEEKFSLDVFPKYLNFEFGHYGVQLFFIISGFVIFMSIKKDTNYLPPKTFLFRRFTRLYPTFWVCLILTFLFTLSFSPLELRASYKDFMLNLTMLPKLFGGNFVDGVYWTLAVEMAFYFIILMLLVTSQMKNYLIFGWMYLLLGFILLLKYNLVVYYLHGLLFLMGMSFYSIWQKENVRVSYCFIFISLLLYALQRNVELFFVVAFLVVLFFLLINKKLKFLSANFLLILGAISYPLYLLHQNIGHTIELFLINKGISNSLLIIGIPFTLSFLLAYVVTFYIEKPVLKALNKKYFS